MSDLIKKLAVKPGERRSVLLGSFTEDNPPKGFSVAITPDPALAGSVRTEVTSEGTAEQYKLVMHVANYGTKTIYAEVCRL